MKCNGHLLMQANYYQWWLERSRGAAITVADQTIVQHYLYDK